jgi:hypothetical protein
VEGRLCATLESISVTARSPGQVQPFPWASVGGMTLGVGAVLLALFMVLPVAVNLPDSWFGALLAVLIGAIGIVLVAVHSRRLWANAKQSGKE